MDTYSYAPLEPKEVGEAIRAFRAEKCPYCNVKKDLKSEPFCDKCLGMLSPKLRDRMFDHATFIDTFHIAMIEIKERSAAARKKLRRSKSEPAPESSDSL